MDKTVFSLIKQTLGAGLNELKRLKSNGVKGKMSWWTEENKSTLAAVFVVADSKIIHEFKKSERSERFDLAKIIIDPNKEGIEIHTSYYQCDYWKKKKRNSLNRRNSLEKSPLMGMYEKSKELTSPRSKELTSPRSLSSLTLKYIDSQTVTLKDVLENDTYREYFKVYTLSKFCVENVLFIEEVYKYKNLAKEKRKSFGNSIMDLFFENGSSYELNTNQDLKIKAKNGVENGEDEAFDEVIAELTNTVLLGMFKDFKDSTLYVDMLLQKKLE